MNQVFNNICIFFLMISLIGVGFLGTPSAQAFTERDLAPYLQQFRSGDRAMRNTAADSLAKQGSSIIPILLNEIDKEYKDSKGLTPYQAFVIRGILLTFIKMKDSSVTPSLFKYLDMPDVELVGFVTQTICHISDGNKNTIHKLLEILAKENSIIREIGAKKLESSQEIQLMAPHSIKGIGIWTGLEEAYIYTTSKLINAINDSDRGIRVLALELLRNMVDSLLPDDRQKIEKEIRQLASNDSTEVHDAAHELLRVMGKK